MRKLKNISLSVGMAALILLTYHVYEGIGRTSAVSSTQAKLRLMLRQPNNTELTRVTINQWDYLIGNDGTYFANASATKSGGFYPRGSGYDAVYAAGMYIGTKKLGALGAPDTLTVSDVEFNSEMQPGKILVDNVVDEQGYRGDKDYNVANTITGSLGVLGYESPDLAKYQSFYIDKNSDGSADYNAWIDDEHTYMPRTSAGKPGRIADGQTYGIFHDMETSQQNPVGNFEDAPGLGLEVEMESFAFESGGAGNALASVVFVKLSITNKSTTDWANTYLGAWMDADIGTQSGTDLANVDTLAGLGYVFNSDNDPSFSATGFDFFQGPLVASGEVSAELEVRFGGNNSVLKYDPGTNTYVLVDLPAGQFTLGATSFTAYRNSDGDPGGEKEDETRYYYLAGFNKTGLPKPQGPYDRTIGANPGDQRIIHGTGPFILRSGSTQEIWLGIIGGQGTVNTPESDPRSGVAKMKAFDGVAQNTFSTGFAKPETPITPTVNVNAYDGQVVVTWDNKAEYSADTYGERSNIVAGPVYNRDYVKYDFQGYRVYRSLTGLDGSFEMLAEYDLVDGITTVTDTLLRTDGSYLIGDMHIGSDVPLQNYYIDDEVVNGTAYYYSVTSFDYQPMYYVNGVPANSEAGAAIPRSSETSLTGRTNLRSAVPKAVMSGYAVDAAPGSIVQIAGSDEGGVSNGKAVESTLINPNAVSSKTYRIEFSEVPATINGKTVVGFPAGTVLYRFIDSATGANVKLDNGADDPRTFLDSNGNGVLDLSADGSVSTNSGDELYDDSYFATSIITRKLDGTFISSTNNRFAILDGIQYKAYQLENGVVDIVQLTDGATEISPRSVLLSASANGKWKVGVYDFAASKVWDKNLTAARRHIDSTFSKLDHDYQIEFGAPGIDTAYFRTGTTFTALQDGNNKGGIPFTVHDVGPTFGYENTSAVGDSQLLVKLHDWWAPGPTNANRTVEYRYDTTLANTGYISACFSAVRWRAHPTGSDPFPASTGVLTGLSELVSFSYIGFQAIIGTTAADTASFLANSNDWMPSTGTKLLLVRTKKLTSGDIFQTTPRPNSAFSSSKARKDLKKVLVVPNPYYGASSYQKDAYDKRLKFTHLPSSCTIYIFDVAGNLVRRLVHNDVSSNDRLSTDPLNPTDEPAAQSTSNETWDLRNRDGQYVASGMYVALIDAKGIGKTTTKFAVIMEENRTEVSE